MALNSRENLENKMYVTTIHTRFQEVKDTRKVKAKCTKCGKTRTRTLSSYQTINPFNRNPDGTIKSHADIRAFNAKDLDKQEKEFNKSRSTFVCNSCA